MNCTPRVLFTNNYPMGEARLLCDQGRYPRHHLWGVDALERMGFEVEYLPDRHDASMSPLAAGASRRLGDMRAELAAWRMRGRNVVCYSASTSQLAGAAMLRKMGAWRMPVVAAVHPTIPDWFSARTMLRSLDVALSPSKRLAEELIARANRDPARTLPAPWGPDLAFPGYSESTDAGVIVSTGKVGRDLETLLRALAAVPCTARVYGRPPPGVPVPTNVTMVGRAPYVDVLRDLASARAVAIPLSVTGYLAGLTEVNDALALGKPIVMTRNCYVDPDPEADGFGITVGAGAESVDEWVDALRLLVADAARARSLGGAGRALAQRQWNSEEFARILSFALRLALQR